jgi:plasmid stabilization system protein ParE
LRFTERTETLASLLARHPTIGRRTDLSGVRVFAIRPYPYLLFYRSEPDDSGITVLRVRHMARKEDWRTGR